MMKWAKEKLETLLIGSDLAVPVAEGRATIVEMTKFEGDASVSTRKGWKKFGCFDLSFTLRWEARRETRADDLDDDDAVKGEIKVKEFCSTNDEDEYTFEVTTKDGSAEAKELFKSRVETSLKERGILLAKLRQFCDELKAQ